MTLFIQRQEIFSGSESIEQHRRVYFILLTDFESRKIIIFFSPTLINPCQSLQTCNEFGFAGGSDTKGCSLIV